jgi:hypothetical protein
MFVKHHLPEQRSAFERRVDDLEPTLDDLDPFLQLRLGDGQRRVAGEVVPAPGQFSWARLLEDSAARDVFVARNSAAGALQGPVWTAEAAADVTGGFEAPRALRTDTRGNVSSRCAQTSAHGLGREPATPSRRAMRS